jgi:hypothetical protein
MPMAMRRPPTPTNKTNPIGLRGVTSLVQRLTSKQLPVRLAEETRALDAELHGDPDSPRCAVAWLIDKDSFTPTYPGLLHYLGWTIWPDIFVRWSARSAGGAKKNAGSVTTAPLVGRRPRWLSWSARWIPAASDSSLAVVAKHFGVIGETLAPSATTRMIVN